MKGREDMADQTNRDAPPERFADPIFLRTAYGIVDPLQVRITTHQRYGLGQGDIFRSLTRHLATVHPPQSVLDVGAGIGNWYAAVRQELGPLVHYTGLDQSPAMVSTLAERMQDDSAAVAVSGDAAALPWPDAHFDWVGLHFMLYHVPDIAGALSEADRVLKPGGILSAATNGPLQYRELMALHRQAVAELGLPTVPDAGPLRFSLSNGRHFFPPDRTVQAEVHTGGFRFPAADPAAAYYDSGFYRVGLDPEVARAHKEQLVERLRQHVADIIRRDGAFTVVSESGYFWYQKPEEPTSR